MCPGVSFFMFFSVWGSQNFLDMRLKFSSNLGKYQPLCSLLPTSVPVLGQFWVSGHAPCHASCFLAYLCAADLRLGARQLGVHLVGCWVFLWSENENSVLCCLDLPGKLGRSQMAQPHIPLLVLFLWIRAPNQVILLITDTGKFLLTTM